MKYTVEIKKNEFHSYLKDDICIYTIGQVSYKDNSLKGELFLNTVLDLFSLKSLKEEVKHFYGRFGIIIINQDRHFIISDLMNTIPIYYNPLKKKITDLVELKGNMSMKSMIFYKEFSYTAQNTTLLENWFVTETASFVELNFEGVKSKSRYYDFNVSSTVALVEDELYSWIDEEVRAVFKRLFKKCASKQVVIPLSGGYDSRLIATFAKEFDIQNVLCFTYGLSDKSEEVMVSKKVAESLGFNWEYVDLNAILKQQHFKKNQSLLHEFYRYSDTIRSVPHIQDFFVINYLKEKQLIESNAIIIPGHSADALAGSHLIRYQGKDVKNIEAFSHILYEKFGIFSQGEHKVDNVDCLINSFESSSYNENDFLDWFHKFNIENRQSKFIVNSTNVYAFYGYEYELPFWDKQYVDLWLGIPFKTLIAENTFENYIFNYYFTKHEVAIYKKKNLVSKATEKKRFLRTLLPDKVYKFLKSLVIAKSNYGFGLYYDLLQKDLQSKTIDRSLHQNFFISEKVFEIIKRKSEAE